MPLKRSENIRLIAIAAALLAGLGLISGAIGDIHILYSKICNKACWSKKGRK